VKEPEKWQRAKEESTVGHEMGSIGELFRDPKLRRNTIAALLMAVAGQGALWGIGFWSVDLLTKVLEPFSVAATDVDRTKSIMFLVQQVGAMVGIYLFAGFSERTNRRTAFFLWFTLGCLAIPMFIWGTALAKDFVLPSSIDSVLGVLTFSSALPLGARTSVEIATLLAFFLGFATLGPFSGYNGARFLAALAPLALGGLTAHFARTHGAVGGGMPMAATVVTGIYLLGFIGVAIAPETKGKALPE
jgi:hypothetical protein